MQNCLQRFYIQSDRPRIFLPKAPSLFINYLPNDGLITVLNKRDFSDSPSFRYATDIFGKPTIQTVAESDLVLYPNARVLASDYFPKRVMQSALVGFLLNDLYWQLNDKAFFQQLVQSTLGKIYSTNPSIIPENSEIASVIQRAQKQLGENMIVLRIPDAHVVSGSGKGVRFVSEARDIPNALLSMNGILGDDGRLRTRVMVERFIPHAFSPSTTYFIGSDTITPLTVNIQFITQGKFSGGTNYFPKKMERTKTILREKGLLLAEQIRQMGGRGFLGIDWLVGEDIVATEANYRATKTITAEMQVQRAKRFTLPPDSAYWILFSRIPYTDSVPDFDAVLHLLRKEKFLYEGAEQNEFIHPWIIPHSDVKGSFDALFVWNKDLRVTYEEQKSLFHQILDKMNR